MVLVKFTDERQINEVVSRRGFSPIDFLKTAKRHDIGYDLPSWLPDGPLTLYPDTWWNALLTRFGLSRKSRIDLPTGLRICLPENLGARIVSRSSTFFRLGLEVYEGLIDPGYTGELKVMVLNRTRRKVTVTDGQRLAQVVFFQVIRPGLHPVAFFPETDRGDDGFGSTGA